MAIVSQTNQILRQFSQRIVQQGRHARFGRSRLIRGGSETGEGKGQDKAGGPTVHGELINPGRQDSFHGISLPHIRQISSSRS